MNIHSQAGPSPAPWWQTLSPGAKRRHTCPLPEFSVNRTDQWECRICGRVWITKEYGWIEIRGPYYDPSTRRFKA